MTAKTNFYMFLVKLSTSFKKRCYVHCTVIRKSKLLYFENEFSRLFRNNVPASTALHTQTPKVLNIQRNAQEIILYFIFLRDTRHSGA